MRESLSKPPRYELRVFQSALLGLAPMLLVAGCIPDAAGTGENSGPAPQGTPTLDELILRPNPTIKQTPADFGYQYDEVMLPLAEGRSIVVWHVRADAPRAAVLIIPGSDANKSAYAAALPLLMPHGYDCVLMDYEGFGNSPGQPSLANTVDDAYAATNYALSLGHKTVIIAASLGTPLAVRVAADMDFAGIILEGTLVLKEEGSLYVATNNGLPFIGAISNAWIGAQTPDAYDILKYIPQVAEPKLFMQSPDDEVTPYAGARKVFDAAADPKQFWDMTSGHGQMIHIDPQAYEQHVAGFIDSVIQ